MDVNSKQYPLRYDAFGTNAERLRPHADRRKENPFLFRAVDSSVDPVGGSAEDKTTRFLSPRYPSREQQPRPQTDQMTPPAQILEESERMERQLQQSIHLLNQKKQMQQQLLLMQQQHIQQQRQIQQKNQQFQQSQLIRNHQQERQFRQQSPERQRREQDVENQEALQKPKQIQNDEMPAAVQFSESCDDVTVQDLFLQCQNHLNVINTCTDLQQTIKDEMKKQAKLDNIICQKLMSKAQRLQQHAAFLEKAHAPSWVGPALLELGTHVSQQAELHHIYTTTLVEQCVVIQHSLDGHHELMKSVLAQNTDMKQNCTPTVDTRNKNVNTQAFMSDKSSKAEGESRSMTFLQASNIFECIRKPRMKLLSSFEYQQEQLKATLMHLNQVESEIEALSLKEENETLMWRIQLQKKDLEIRKEFLEARKEQLESDVQFARMDMNDFEQSHKESMLEVLHVFYQHRTRYDTTLKQSFQLLKAASLRDISFLKKLTKRSDLDANTERESGDAYEVMNCTQRDPWSCAKRTASKTNVSATTGNTEHIDEIPPLTVMQKNVSPQISKNKSPYVSKGITQEQIENKVPTNELAYPIMLSSDSELSFMSKTDMQKSILYPTDFKQINRGTVGSFSTNFFPHMTDFNFSRADSSPSITDVNEVIARQDVVQAFSNSSKTPAWTVNKEGVQRFPKEMCESEDDESNLIIAKYIDDKNFNERQSCKSHNNSRIEDIMIVSRAPKTRPTLGNFENSINSDCSLYPMSLMREISCNKEEKRIAHFIGKYASGSHSSQTSLGKNWNSCKPLVRCGINKGKFKGSVSQGKTSRSFKCCEPLIQHDVLTEYCESKHISDSESSVEHCKGQNMNNSETLKARSENQNLNSSEPTTEDNENLDSCEPLTECKESSNSCDTLTEVASCEQLTGHSVSQSLNACEHFTESNEDPSMSTCESVTGQNVCHSVNDSEHMTDDNVSQNVNSGESLESKSVSQNKDSCELLSGQMSRNLNNCEPLKTQVVDTENVLEGEDRLDFEVTQVLFPDTRPRNIRVCAVRPISSDAGGGSTVVAITNGSRDHGSNTGLSSKYDNLKLYEVTAGQFIVPEEETESKCKVRTDAVDYSNNEWANFCCVNSQICPHSVCLNRSDCSSYAEHSYESMPHNMVESKAKLQSGMTDCAKLPSENVANGSPRGMLRDRTIPSGREENTVSLHITIQCHEVVDKDELASEGDLKAVSVDDYKEVKGNLSELSSESGHTIRNPSPLKYAKPESAYVLPNIPLSEASFDGSQNEEETQPKTVYIPQQLDTKVKCNDSQYKYNPRDVTESPGTGVHLELQDFIGYKTVLEKEHTKYTTKQISDTSGYAQSIHEKNPKETSLFVKNNDACYSPQCEDPVDNFEEDKTIIIQHVSIDRNITEQAIPQHAFEVMSKQSGNQINQNEELGENSCDPPWSQKQEEYCIEQVNGRLHQDMKGFTYSPQPQMQNRPLKSNLKKPSITYSLDNNVNDEIKQINYERSFQYGQISLPGISDNDLCLQGECEKNFQQLNDKTVQHLYIGKTHKCVKQVRFHHRVHYDDNTETDTVDCTFSDNTSALSCSFNNKKNCTYCTKTVSAEKDEVMMYSTILTSPYVTDFSSVAENNVNFSNNGFMQTMGNSAEQRQLR